MSKYIFTSESVTEGHPDKICDQISDAILDDLIRQDPDSRAGIETTVTTGLVSVIGEIRTNGYVDIPKIVRETILEIGYDKSEYGFEGNDVGVVVSIDEQSPDIAQGIDEGSGKFKKQGAGDQGIMFGYASNETEEFMPASIMLAHKLVMRLAQVRKDGTMAYLRPDGKSEVAVEYVDGKPVRLESVVIAAQHDPEVDVDKLEHDIIENVIKSVAGDMIDDKTRFFINATGKFVKGGPPADAGLTGRKIIVDTYGGHGAHGGGCFSGKDPSKVDRSASYMARYIAKNIVAAGLADKCELQLAYVIGVAEPISVMVETFGTSNHSNEDLEKLIRDTFPLEPAEIIKHLDLKRPIYKKTASYGHFGRPEPEFTWERVDKSGEIQKFIKV